MPILFDPSFQLKRIIPTIFVIEASGTMQGERMASINQTLRSAITLLSETNLNSSDDFFYAKYAVLRFATGAQWLTEGLTEPISAHTPHITADGLADLGCALDLLNAGLSRKSFLCPTHTYTLPLIFFITDGNYTDDYKKALNTLKENNWYKHSIKLAIGLGNDVDLSVLQEITDNPELVISLENTEALEPRLLELLSYLLKPLIFNCSAVRDTKEPEEWPASSGWDDDTDT